MCGRLLSNPCGLLPFASTKKRNALVAQQPAIPAISAAKVPSLLLLLLVSHVKATEKKPVHPLAYLFLSIFPSQSRFTVWQSGWLCRVKKNIFLKKICMLFFHRIVERGFYSERDAAHVVKQILEAVSVSRLNVSFLFLGSCPCICFGGQNFGCQGNGNINFATFQRHLFCNWNFRRQAHN